MYVWTSNSVFNAVLICATACSPTCLGACAVMCSKAFFISSCLTVGGAEADGDDDTFNTSQVPTARIKY
jgi:hypothetical protein